MRSLYKRLTQFEYWPFYILYLPVLPLGVFYGIRLRSLAWFTSVNPGIKGDGCGVDGKFQSLSKLPIETIPNTRWYSKTDWQSLTFKEITQELGFPFIIKPDNGARGNGVSLITSEEKFKAYQSKIALWKHQPDIIIQEYLNYSEEYGVMVYKSPWNPTHIQLLPITHKSFLKIEGDGKSPWSTLFAENKRAKLQLDRWKQEYHSIWNSIPIKGEVLLPEPIGNHCRGTAFHIREDLISDAVQQKAAELIHALEGVNICRFDLKCTSEQDFLKGNNWKILEVNGVYAEPTYIYQQGYSLKKAYSAILYQLNTSYQIAKFNIRNGAKPVSFVFWCKSAYAFLKRSKISA